MPSTVRCQAVSTVEQIDAASPHVTCSLVNEGDDRISSLETNSRQLMDCLPNIYWHPTRKGGGPYCVDSDLDCLLVKLSAVEGDVQDKNEWLANQAMLRSAECDDWEVRPRAHPFATRP
jgi:hypothetical protein